MRKGGRGRKKKERIHRPESNQYLIETAQAVSSLTAKMSDAACVFRWRPDNTDLFQGVHSLRNRDEYLYGFRSGTNKILGPSARCQKYNAAFASCLPKRLKSHGPQRHHLNIQSQRSFILFDQDEYPEAQLNLWRLSRVAYRQLHCYNLLLLLGLFFFIFIFGWHIVERLKLTTYAELPKFQYLAGNNCKLISVTYDWPVNFRVACLYLIANRLSFAQPRSGYDLSRHNCQSVPIFPRWPLPLTHEKCCMTTKRKKREKMSTLKLPSLIRHFIYAQRREYQFVFVRFLDTGATITTPLVLVMY